MMVVVREVRPGGQGRTRAFTAANSFGGEAQRCGPRAGNASQTNGKQAFLLPPNFHEMPTKVVETPFPPIDADPHAGRVIRYFRASDYAAWAAGTIGVPSAMSIWSMPGI